MTRDHSIARDRLPGTDIPVLNLIGGKWILFRAFLEQAANLVLAILGSPRRVTTQDMPIGGGRNFQKDPADREQAAVVQESATVAATVLDWYATLNQAEITRTLADLARPGLSSPARRNGYKRARMIDA